MAKNDKWFKKENWSYIPISAAGWLTYVPFIGFLVFSFWAVEQQTDNFAGAFFDVFPYWIGAVVIMHWFAGHKS
jgi:hypothetical protein